MKHYTNNPRKISKRELQQLRKDLEELGDLGGFVHDLNTEMLVERIGNSVPPLFMRSIARHIRGEILDRVPEIQAVTGDG